MKVDWSIIIYSWMRWSSVGGGGGGGDEKRENTYLSERKRDRRNFWTLKKIDKVKVEREKEEEKERQKESKEENVE